MNEIPSFRIWHENLVATGADGRLPLSKLALDEHIHGGLRLQFGERVAPHLGFFGPDDVCLNTWLEELWAVSQAFNSSCDAQYTFNEGEQGQPAFVFERRGDCAYFSIADAEFSGGQTDPDWQRVDFSPIEFLAEHARFRNSFFAEIRAAAPQVADQWIRQHDPKNRGI